MSMLSLLLVACDLENGLSSTEEAAPDLLEGTARRTPAEWEEQEAVWLQWPQSWEGRQVEQAFANIVTAIADFEDVHVIVNSAGDQETAEDYLVDADTERITFHQIATDSSWFRDNGPTWIELDGQIVVQDWDFDAWGYGARWSYQNDDVVPERVAEILGLPWEHVNIVHERGDLEVNGTDTALVSWSVLTHRNPDASKEQITEGLQKSLGVESVIYVEGWDPMDITRGHVDGLVRFVAEDTVVVGNDGSELMDSVAEQIAEQRPDLTIERLESPDAALFLNYLVGNGFVLMGDSGTAGENAVAKAAAASWFPGREVRFVNVDALWQNGGGIHCVTNDQPKAP